MWLVKQVTEKNKLNTGRYIRYNPRTQKILSEEMTIDEIVEYCIQRQYSDKYARNFLQFAGHIDEHPTTKEGDK